MLSLLQNQPLMFSVYLFVFRRQLSWDDPMTDVAGYELTVVLKPNRRQHLSFPGVPNHNIVCITFNDSLVK